MQTRHSRHYDIRTTVRPSVQATGMTDRLCDIWNWLRDRLAREGSCTWVRTRLQAYIDWDVYPREYVCIEQHLTRCDACRQEHEELRRFLVETFSDARPPGSVEIRRERLLAAVERLAAVPVSVAVARPRAARIAWACAAVAVSLLIACCMFPLLDRDDQASGKADAENWAALVRIPRDEPLTESVDVEAAIVELELLLRAMTEDNASRIAAEIADSSALTRCLLDAVVARATEAGADAAELGERARLLLDRETPTDAAPTPCATRATPEEIEPLLRRLVRQD